MREIPNGHCLKQLHEEAIRLTDVLHMRYHAAVQQDDVACRERLEQLLGKAMTRRVRRAARRYQHLTPADLEQLEVLVAEAGHTYQVLLARSQDAHGEEKRRLNRVKNKVAARLERRLKELQRAQIYRVTHHDWTFTVQVAS